VVNSYLTFIIRGDTHEPQECHTPKTSFRLADRRPADGGLCRRLGGAPARQPPPYRIEAGLAACFCPSNHANQLLSTRTQVDELIAGAPCTSRGDGAEERARAWGDGCQRAISAAGVDFTREAVLYVGRFFSSGMIRGSLTVSGPEDGVLKVEIVRHQPPGPLTPDIGFFRTALVIDKGQVSRTSTDDGHGNAIVLPLTTTEKAASNAP
jgi:hypothetical protein